MVNKISMNFCIFFINVLLITIVCSCTVKVQQYPIPSDILFEKSNTIDGISAVVQPLNREKAKTYFGTDMYKKGVVPIYFSIKNNNPDKSFIFDPELVKLLNDEALKSETLKSIDRSITKDSENIGVAISNVGAGGIAIVPIVGLATMGLGALKEIDARIIEENMEIQKLRSKTIDPGQSVSGFLYYNLNDLKKVMKNDKINYCYQLLDPLSNESIPFCLIMSTKEVVQ